MNITEFARLGGKSRWKGKTKKQRKEAMRNVALARWKKAKKALLDKDIHRNADTALANKHA